jgi:hypothetical protein
MKNEEKQNLEVFADKVKKSANISMQQQDFNKIHQNLNKEANRFEKKQRFMKRSSVGLVSALIATFLFILALSQFNIGMLSTDDSNKETAKYEEYDESLVVEGSINNAEVVEDQFKANYVWSYLGFASANEYHNKTDKFDSVNSVPTGVYLKAGADHQGKNYLQIYSKVHHNKEQKVRFVINDQVLQIHIYEKEEASFSIDSSGKQHRVFHTNLIEKPTVYEVYRNGEFEVRKEITYSVTGN